LGPRSALNKIDVRVWKGTADVLEVQNLVKTFDGEKKKRRGSGEPSSNGDAARVFAVNDISFKVEPGELFTLLGPSGCGKSTTLRSTSA
jgi:iron(III) transport system ATP-binding protein